MPISGKPEIGGAEFIIGPRFARTRWLAPRNDNNCYAATMLGVAR